MIFFKNRGTQAKNAVTPIKMVSCVSQAGLGQRGTKKSWDSRTPRQRESERLRKAEVDVALLEAVNSVAAGGLRNEKFWWVEEIAVIDAEFTADRCF